MISDAFSLDKCLIEPVESSSFSWPAKRPRDSSLDTAKAQQDLRVKPLELGDALERLRFELSQQSG